MTFKQLTHICNPVSITGSPPEKIGTFSQDSRTVKEHSVFIAVKGTQVDGHQFIDEAIKNGASIIICEGNIKCDDRACFMQVEDTRSLVGPIAQEFEDNPSQKLKIIGITGTNGKTTVATLTYQILRALGERPSLLSTVAKHIGADVLDSRLTTEDPIELANDMRRMVEADSSHLVMEVSSHALDQKRVEGVHFNVAAFTNLSHDHLDYHGDFESYAAAKKRLFDGLTDRAAAVINNDDRQASLMARDCRGKVVLFGFKNPGSVQCRLIENNRNGIIIEIDGQTIKSALIGRFNATNVAQAFLICRALGYETQPIAEALKSAVGAPGRLQRVQIGKGYTQPLVLVDYAHTPGALENILQAVQNIKKPNQKLHLIFGCGGDRDREKRPKMAAIAELYADKVTITSDNPRSEDPDVIIDDAMKGFTRPNKVKRITDRKEAIERAIEESDDHSILLIAGKGHETYQEVEGVRRPFDDRKIVRRALSNRNGNFKTQGQDNAV
jgi:UDP-N-acetylmuramoyl-L-alanyl-D-glutamate--2,6-diaminopimelate ligase